MALRQQVIVLKRTVNRAEINDSDRAFWILMKRSLKDWNDVVTVVKPETMLPSETWPTANDENSPIPRRVERRGHLVVKPALGGLHDVYSRGLRGY